LGAFARARTSQEEMFALARTVMLSSIFEAKKYSGFEKNRE
jgi:hypothetical protein